MKVKDLLPILPRYKDDSGYDVKVIYDDEESSLFLCNFDTLGLAMKYDKNFLEKEVKLILPGIGRINGEWDEQLQIVVKEKE